ncbi:MAG TPA: hypothetical protein VJ889_26025, partial [Pseudomonas sp.]|nr:hypothetical protein [Pseudomonas sp.]
MNTTSRLCSKSGSLLGRLLTTGLSVWLLGVAFTPALAATPSPVVDQAPLIIQKPLPPNIVLMLDDSGSMAWDYMPDWDYLKNNSNNAALIDSSNNGVYYNPKVVYTPPVKADGTLYPDASGLTSAWVDGFKQSSGSKDLTAYSSGIGGIDYSTGSAQYYNSNVSSESSCSSKYGSMNGYGGYTYSSRRDTCQFTYYTSVAKYFQYSIGDASGPYEVHYVAATDCGTQTNCVLASDTSGVAAPNQDAGGKTLLAQDGTPLSAGQNIANWFAYYHTRILMAKSGVMNAFSAVDSTYRIGFGSINGNNDSNLPAPNAAYGSNNNYIAQVMPFGSGATGTQKASFWSWIAGGKANNSTPLRRSLDAVGRYYQTAQPWQTSANDTTELACRQSYTILTTDGFWNGGDPSNIGNVDNTKKGPITGPNNQPFTYSPAAPYSDNISNTLADVAMKYWVTDLRTAVNEVPTSKEDPAFWQHMVTFTLGMGFDPINIQPAGT